MLDKNTVLVAIACLYKEVKGKGRWFLIKQGEDGDWEFPKVLVRKGESSVRAILRLMAEKGTMTTKVLEEAGRAGGVATIGSKTLPQRNIYYLMVYKSGAKEAIGFSEYHWLEYSKAVKKLISKRDKQMLKAATKILRQLMRDRKRN
ncbi:hypothetical protein A2159_03490 [Candidatus Woesebacteria bacterium RBG_13_34_9]|uniref:Nudix hydrolase domain-containing protein n=1 Tax=Candidatus Woesebacteria bacterium RBG_13_34_9 TaxID=1802477 RepID=A0A1F7X6D4_9BACT|nr:MAG: hypothetical protein A2159_03490 [Candidatus Woesebacteria bacterium RBG_13_34_9]